MARAYSQDLRDRVLAATAEVFSARGAAERSGVGIKTAIEIGSAAPGRPAKRRRASKVTRRVRSSTSMRHSCWPGRRKDDVTLAEMQAQLRAERGVSTGTTTLWRFFDTRGLTFKKRVPTRPSRTGPTS